jgi:hypothetical protein
VGDGNAFSIPLKVHKIIHSGDAWVKQNFPAIFQIVITTLSSQKIFLLAGTGAGHKDPGSGKMPFFKPKKSTLIYFYKL